MVMIAAHSNCRSQRVLPCSPIVLAVFHSPRWAAEKRLPLLARPSPRFRRLQALGVTDRAPTFTAWRKSRRCSRLPRGASAPAVRTNGIDARLEAV